jgi:hypothetical protein
MANPIQQLVDAAKMVGDESTCCDEYHEAGCPVLRLRAAIRAVESAQVETRFVVEINRDPGRWGYWGTFKSDEDAAKEIAMRKLNVARIVRIDTYRSVEGDQK